MENIVLDGTVSSQKKINVFHYSSSTHFSHFNISLIKKALFNQGQVFNVNSYLVGSIFSILAVHKTVYLTINEILG